MCRRLAVAATLEPYADQLLAPCCCLVPWVQNTHNGDQIEVEGSAFVVQAVVMQYKLVRGKYR